MKGIWFPGGSIQTHPHTSKGLPVTLSGKAAKRGFPNQLQTRAWGTGEKSEWRLNYHINDGYSLKLFFSWNELGTVICNITSFSNKSGRLVAHTSIIYGGYREDKWQKDYGLPPAEAPALQGPSSAASPSISIPFPTGRGPDSTFLHPWHITAMTRQHQENPNELIHQVIVIIQIMGRGRWGENLAGADAQTDVIPAVLPGVTQQKWEGLGISTPQAALSLSVLWLLNIWKLKHVSWKMQAFSHSKTKKPGCLWSDISKKAWFSAT